MQHECSAARRPASCLQQAWGSVSAEGPWQRHGRRQAASAAIDITAARHWVAILGTGLMSSAAGKKQTPCLARPFDEAPYYRRDALDARSRGPSSACEGGGWRKRAAQFAHAGTWAADDAVITASQGLRGFCPSSSGIPSRRHRAPCGPMAWPIIICGTARELQATAPRCSRAQPLRARRLHRRVPFTWNRFCTWAPGRVGRSGRRCDPCSAVD